MLDHLDDLESDFLVFYKIDNMYELQAEKFFRLAYRVSAYEGVMKMRVQQLANRAPAPTQLHPAQKTGRPPRPHEMNGEGTPISDPSIAQYFEVA